jgi:outer membrane protein OmpA-like peptidoglycan-associated protein
MPEDNIPHEHQTEAELPVHDAPAATATTKPALPPAVILAFVILVLLGALIALGLRGRINKSGAGTADLAEQQAEVSALRSQLNRDRVAMGLRPLEGGSEPMEDIAARLKKDADSIVALAASYQSMMAEKSIELSAKNAEILRSEQLRQSLAAESARLQGELQRALVNGSDADLLRRDLATMKSQRDALAAELTTVRQELAAKGQGVSADEVADLKRQFEEIKRAKEFFESKVKDLTDQLAAAQAKQAELAGQLSTTQAKLFASSENELLPAAVELFRSLRALENRPDSEISAAYSNLGEKLGATVLQTCTFDTGSSALNPVDQEKLRNLVSLIPDGDLLLAIGYASETGNVDGNRTLSSSRATAAAELYSSVKRKEQLVQAVYLGQTDRFSGKIPERNQLVEIWRIRKK